jgi:hypothetical protein
VHPTNHATINALVWNIRHRLCTGLDSGGTKRWSPSGRDWHMSPCASKWIRFLPSCGASRVTRTVPCSNGSTTACSCYGVARARRQQKRRRGPPGGPHRTRVGPWPPVYSVVGPWVGARTRGGSRSRAPGPCLPGMTATSRRYQAYYRGGLVALNKHTPVTVSWPHGPAPVCGRWGL